MTAPILADRSVPYEHSTDTLGDDRTNTFAGAYGWQNDFSQEVGALTVVSPGNANYWEQKSGAASWVLHTGGLSVAGNNESLLALTGTATAEVPGTGYDAGLLVQGSGVAGPDITNTGQVEDTNNTAYLVLPDGTTTQSAMIPNVPLARVNNALGQYTLVASANSQWLGDGGTTPNPQFCVGQQVTFAPSWIPSTPPYLNAVAHWSLPGTFVNTNSDPNCDRYYSEDPSQLNRVQTSCWYVDKLQSGSATLAMNLTLNNGQQVILNASGQFNVFRPTTAQASPYQPDGTPTAEITNVTYNVWMGKTIQKTLLSLSLGDGNGHNDMSFSHTINPGNFSGQAGYVQLITSADVENSEPPPAPFNGTALDGALGEFPRGTPAVPANTTTGVSFFDGPAVPLPNNDQPVWEDVSFSTYLMFRPDPQTNSIWVPLRLITWEDHNSADPTWTPHNSNNMSGATQTTTSNPSDHDHESTVFPDWTAPY